MEERTYKVGKVEIVLGQGSRLLKILVIVLLTASTLALGAMGWADLDLRGRIADMRTEAAGYAYENAQLKEKIAGLDTMNGIERIAREELGMVDADTILIEAQVK